MRYEYQSDDMDALRQTFEDMLEEIHDLRQSIVDGDAVILELYEEANDLEAEIHTLEEHIERMRNEYDQVIFDLQEDNIDLQQEYNELAEMYSDLYDEFHSYVDIEDAIEDDGFITVLQTTYN